MPIAPDSRYYVHASTHAARAQQRYLVGESGNPRHGATMSRGIGIPRFSLRTDWWVVLVVVGLAALVTGLMAFVR